MDSDWIERLEDARAVVLHLPTGVIGKVKPMDDSVARKVITFEEGHTFVAKDEGAFVVLTPQQVEFHLEASKTMRLFFGGMAGEAFRKGMPLQVATRVLIAILEAQLRELQMQTA